MPEGHVAHRNAGLWRTHLVGHQIRRAWSHDPRSLTLQIPQRMEGRTITAAEARGKHHLLTLDDGHVLHTHLRMNGVWRLVPGGRPVSSRGLTLALECPSVTAALYRCQAVTLLDPGAPLPNSVRNLGPDLLDPDVDPGAAMATALAGVDPGREVGDAIMDQSVISGIGNVYKSETLFLVGVSPWRAVGSVTPAEAEQMGSVGSALLHRGVAEPGKITTYDPPNRAWRRPMGERWVYRRADEPCRRCGTRIRSRGQGDDNRTTYWCPACQT